MIKTEFYITRQDGVNLYRTYSDLNKKIKQVETGIIYDDAIDIQGKYTYIETDQPIEQQEEQPEPPDVPGVLKPQQALNIIFGGES